MLQLYDINHVKLVGLDDYKNYYIQLEIGQLDILDFLYPIADCKYKLILEECYIVTKNNEYVVKEVNCSDENYDEYVCKVNIESIQGTVVDSIQTVEQICEDVLTLALTGTGWSIGTYNLDNRKRSISKVNCTAYDVLQEIQSTYSCEMSFDAINKRVNVFQSIGTDKGVYFSDKLNLKKIDNQRSSYDYITRLIPLGNDNMDITTVNGGKKYIENYQYSNKVLTAYWVDTDYTVPQDLYDDAVARLAYLSIPLNCFSVDIYDLAKVSDKYQILDYSIGDFVTLVSKERNTREKQRIVQMVRYIDEPEKSTVQLANKIASLADLQISLQNDVSELQASKDSTTLTENVLYNTSFERYRYGTRQPLYWSGGTVVSEKNYKGAYSVQLSSYQMMENILDYRPDPTNWNGGLCKLLFRKLGGSCQLQIFDSNTWAPISMTLPNNTITTACNIPSTVDWGIDPFYVTFDSTGHGKIWVRFTNDDTTDCYLDCVQLCPWDSKSDIVYADGQQSTTFVDSYSDIWFEYISVAFISSLTVQFENIYSAMPNVSINTDTGLAYTLSYTLDTNSNYIGCVITFATGTSNKVSISVMGKV